MVGNGRKILPEKNSTLKIFYPTSYSVPEFSYLTGEMIKIYSAPLKKHCLENLAHDADHIHAGISVASKPSSFMFFLLVIMGFLVQFFKENKLWVPKIGNYRFSRNTTIIPGNSLGYISRGIRLPAVITGFHKKIRKINKLCCSKKDI